MPTSATRPLKFLIYISYTYALPIGEPLELEILKQNHCVKWFSDEPEGCCGLENKTNVLHNIKDVIHYHPDIVLSITDSVPDFICGLKVQIFHGFNAEKRKSNRDHFRIRGLFDLYCTQGPSTTSVFKELQKADPHFEVIETGWSKVDPLFPIEENPAISNPPKVIIASTFTERLSLAVREDVFEEIKRLSEKGIFNFKMVMHPKLPKEVKEKWTNLKNEHFQVFDTTYLNPLFKDADVMLSDTTSAIQEFGLQLKPTVTLNHHIPVPYLINITEVSEIETALKKALTYPTELMKELKAYNQELHPYTDGKSSQRVINACVCFLNSNKSHLKRKPLNLVRRMKMRMHLKTLGLKSYMKPYTPKK